MDNKKSPKATVGIVSLLVIFAVLCLTVFSVMALQTAIRERNFAQKRVVSQQNYYKAETKCAHIANEIGTLWEEKSEDELIAFLEENSLKYENNGSSIVVTYFCPIDENQIISVELSLSDTFNINRWQILSTQDWIPDDSINVWDGETNF